MPESAPQYGQVRLGGYGVAAQITQPEIAADVQVSAAAISRWEAGERAPRGAAALRYLRVLERLSAATGVPLDGGAR